MKDDEGLAQLIQKSFLDDRPKQIQTLKVLVARGEARLAGAQAHKIRGAAANVGGERSNDIAAARELAGAEGKQRILEQRLPELDSPVPHAPAGD